MHRGLLLEIHKYFTDITNPTQEEKDLLLQLNGELPYFHITSVHRDDLLQVGFNGLCATDEQMGKIASKMSDDYCEQLFYLSLPIIADYAKVPIKKVKQKFEFCPKCENHNIQYDINNNNHKCNSCGQTWNDIYVLIGYQDGDTTYFEDDDIGYPCFNSEDNCARYVPEYEYILQYGKNPEPNSYYVAVQWPESQNYLENEEEGNEDDIEDSINELCELIEDEKGLEDFGSSAVWVPLCMTTHNEE